MFMMLVLVLTNRQNVRIAEIRVTRHARYVLASVRISPTAQHGMSRADDNARVV